MLQDIPTPTLREASPCVLETERLMLRRPTLARETWLTVTCAATRDRVAFVPRRVPRRGPPRP